MPRSRATPGAAAADWSAWQTARAVAAGGSVAAAAAALRVDASTVLRRIAALEARLGAPLFARVRGAWRPNAQGAALLDGLADAASRLDGVRARVAGHDDTIAGEIRLTTTDTLLGSLLLAPIAAFCAQHPAVRLRIVVDNRFASLVQREADVAIRGSNRPPENLVGRRVGAIRTAPYAARALLDRTPGARRDFTRLPWVAPDESLAHLEQARWLARRAPPLHVVLRVDSLVGMVRAVEAGIGAAMLLVPLADARPGLVPLAPPDPAHDTQVWILTHPDLRRVARVRAFASWMADALGTDARLAH